MTVFVEALNAGAPHRRNKYGEIEQSPVQFHSDDYTVRLVREQCNQSGVNGARAEGVERQAFGYRSFGKT